MCVCVCVSERETGGGGGGGEEKAWTPRKKGVTPINSP